MLGLTTVPYESSISVKPIIVGWCEKCEMVIDPYPGKNHECDGCIDNYTSFEWTPRWIKRRAWKCPDCDGYYLSYAGLLAHDHWYV